MEDIAYPRLLRRVQAVLIDSLIVSILIYICAISVAYIQIENSILRILLAFGPAISLEPIMVAFTGATFGHHFIGLKVRHVYKDRNINIAFAFLRFILKLILGMLSLIFILITRKHQAIHDIFTRAIVIHKNPISIPSREMLKERELEEAGYKYPSKLKKIVVIFSYIILSSVVFGVASIFVASDDCIIYERCSDKENISLIVSSIFLWICFFYFIVSGWKSKLYGCRKVKTDNT